MKDKVAAKTRLQITTQTLLKNQIKARLKQIDIQIRQVDVAIAQKVAQDEALSQKLGILISIPGIAEATAFSMLIEMPELGTLEGKQAASLAGLAPISRQSGKWQGKERIHGGRRFLRRAIYMPALVATPTTLISRRNTISSLTPASPAKSPSQRSCESSSSRQTLSCAMGGNGQQSGLDQDGYSSRSPKDDDEPEILPSSTH
jgi:transposase